MHNDVPVGKVGRVPVTAATLVRGRQEPRLMSIPPEVSNAAQDCIDIYQSCGQRLDDWQELALWAGCGERADTSPAAFEMGLIAQRQQGKGEPVNAVLLASLFVWGNRVTIYSAHRGDTVAATFRKVRALIEGNEDLLRRCKPINDSDDVIELIGGARLEFRTRTRSGGRGLTGDLVVIDEALELDAEQIASLVPVLLAKHYAQLWYVSTVPASADQHLCAVRARVQAGDDRVAWVEWGADADDASDDPNALARANPALGIRITLERLTELRGILGEDLFRRECMGIWPESVQGAALDAAAWARMADRESKVAGVAALALDISPLRDHATIGLYGRRDDGLEHMQLLDYAPAADWDGGSSWVVDRLAEWCSTLDPVGVALHGKNGTRALLDALKERGIEPPDDIEFPFRGALLIMDDVMMADAVGQFIDGFRTRRYRHIGQEPLDTAIVNVKARPIGDAGQIVWARRQSAVNIGPVVTVTAARYLFHRWHDLVVGDYDLIGSLPLVEGVSQCPGCDAFAPVGSPVTHYDDCPTLRDER